MSKSFETCLKLNKKYNGSFYDFIESGYTSLEIKKNTEKIIIQFIINNLESGYDIKFIYNKYVNNKPTNYHNTNNYNILLFKPNQKLYCDNKQLVILSDFFKNINYS